MLNIPDKGKKVLWACNSRLVYELLGKGYF
jgi:hypothetical protein